MAKNGNGNGGKAKGGAVAVRKSGANVPAFMQEDVGKGTEAFGSEDVSVPRLKLIQALSPELEEFNDLRPGNFLHTASGEIFNKPFKGVAVYADKRYILWNPRDSGGGILARADDGVHWNPPDTEFQVKLDKKDGGGTATWRTAKTVQQSGLAAWGRDGTPPVATLMYNFLLAFPELPELPPAVLTFQRSGIAAARKFIGSLKIGPVPIFGRLLEVSSAKTQNRSGQEFFTIRVANVGHVEDEKLYMAYRELHMNFARAGLQVRDIENLQDEQSGDDEPDQPQKQRAY